MVYPNDHRPAHVHVIGNGCQAIFNVAGAVELRENYHFSKRELERIGTALEDNITLLRQAWENIHGNH